MNNSVETVTAAANAIVSAESRVQQVTLPRRRWGACFSMYWCFRSQRHEKRISHGVLVPEQTPTGSDIPPPENPNHSPALSLPFVVPPSSPASFLQSEPPSAAQSPAGFLSFSAFSANAYSPTGPSSIFAIGPYANEPQLVSPPVFSTFTTEPSTAPLTPPPESVQLTTPSSPEVPFAKLLASSFNPREAYEFQSYQLYPGSPIGHLISPSSVCSGTSSPFPDLEFHASGGAHKTVLRRENGSLIDGQITVALDSGVRPPNDEPVTGHRVSFELTAEEVTRCMEKKPTLSIGAASELRPPPPPPAVKEFKFNNADGADVAEPAVGSDWWVHGKVAGQEAGPEKNWAFFPMIQPSVS